MMELGIDSFSNERTSLLQSPKIFIREESGGEAGAGSGFKLLENKKGVPKGPVKRGDIIEGMKKIRRKVRVSILRHRLAKEHFSYKQFWFFFIPQSFIALVSSVLSFMADKESDTGNEMTLAVGVLSLILVAFQNVGRECQFGERAVMHDTAEEGLRTLDLEISNSLTLYRMAHKKRDKKNSEKKADENDDSDHDSDNSDDSDDSNDDDDDDGYGYNQKDNPGNLNEMKKEFATFLKQFRQFELGCKSPIPLHIKNAFGHMDTKVKFYHRQSYSVQTFDDYHRSVFHILSQEISKGACFPICLPRANTVNENVKKVIKQHEAEELELIKGANVDKKKWKLENMKITKEMELEHEQALLVISEKEKQIKKKKKRIEADEEEGEMLVEKTSKIKKDPMTLGEQQPIEIGKGQMMRKEKIGVEKNEDVEHDEEANIDDLEKGEGKKGMTVRGGDEGK